MGAAAAWDVEVVGVRCVDIVSVRRVGRIGFDAKVKLSCY
jgi:hypothetical protein